MMPSEKNHRQISQNVRFVLWREGIQPSQWPKHLRARLGKVLGAYYWTGPSGDSALRRLLTGAELLDGKVSEDSNETDEINEISDIAKSFRFTQEELRSADFLHDSKTDVLHENLRHLVGGLERGGKKQLAAELRLDQTTISRWLSGTSRPPPSRRAQLVSYFGLPAETDLAKDPVFLSPDPLSLGDRKQWLRDRIDAMEAHRLRDLYPALQRLLDEP